jgi:hypothetical protein
MKSFLILLVLLTSTSLFAKDGCGAWEKESGVSCALPNANTGAVWKRDCSRSSYQCKTPIIPANRVACVEDRICYYKSKDPNAFVNDCSAWQRNNGTSCMEGSKKSWFRVCSWARVPDTACSKNKPVRSSNINY